MAPPVFITARFRSGSTLLWNIYRTAVGAHAYYEPLHEQLPELIKRNIKPQARHFFIDSYFEQYPEVNQLARFHKKEFGVHRLFLEKTDAHPEMLKYLKFLIAVSPQNTTTILQENRIDFRLPWVRTNFPEASLIHLYRSPRDQWMSTIQDYPSNIDANIDSDPYRITTWARDLAAQFPFLASPYIRHAYQRHYYLWKLSYLMGRQLADHSLAYEDLLSNPNAHVKDLLAIAQLDSRKNIEACRKLVINRPRDVWKKYQTEGWFLDLEQECEKQLTLCGLNKNFGKKTLKEIIAGSPNYALLIADPRAGEWVQKNSQETIIELLNVADEKEKVLQELNAENIKREQVIGSQKQEVSQLHKKKDQVILKQQRILNDLYAANTKLRSEAQEKEQAILEKEQAILEKEQMVQEKERVVQDFRHSLFFWLVNGPLRYIPLATRFFTFVNRVRVMFLPKLGVLVQHPPKALEIPEKYKTTPALKDAPSISIVTPSYNQAHFIERTLQSVVSQGYPNLQYIVQDGHSTDGTLKILKRYRNSLTRYESRPDDGQAHAINLGFAHTSGEIMAYLNSDDMLLPGALHYVARYFQKHPEVDVVYGHRVIVDEQDHEIGRWVMPPHDPRALYWADYVPQETLFWRRRIWEKIGGKMDESFKFALDWDLLIRFQLAGAKIVCLPRFLGVFRVHGAQKSTAEINELGIREMNLLRKRLHNREVSWKEIANKLRPYLMKSVVYHKLYRLGILRY